MAATRQQPSDDCAVPYSGSIRSGLKPLPFYKGLPAGGGYSTADDLGRFASALLHHKLLDSRHTALLTTARVAAGAAQWSLGARVHSRNGAAYWGHGGSAPGVDGDFAVYPASGYFVAVLANRGHPSGSNVAEYLGRRLPAGVGAG